MPISPDSDAALATFVQQQIEQSRVAVVARQLQSPATPPVTYADIEKGGGYLTNAAFQTYMLDNSARGAGNALSGGATNMASAAFLFDPSWYAGAVLNLRTAVMTNAVAPGINFQFVMSAVSGFTGASGVTPGVTVGATVPGSSLVVNNPGALTYGFGSSGDFAAPAFGLYLVTVVTSGAAAAGSSVWLRYKLQRRV